MRSSDIIRELCANENISVSELAGRISQTLQIFFFFLKRDTVSFDEMILIASALGAAYEQSFMLSDGRKIIAGGGTK